MLTSAQIMHLGMLLRHPVSTLNLLTTTIMMLNVLKKRLLFLISAVLIYICFKTHPPFVCLFNLWEQNHFLSLDLINTRIRWPDAADLICVGFDIQTFLCYFARSYQFFYSSDPILRYLFIFVWGS